MTTRSYVIGVGMTKFDKPGNTERDYPQMVAEAAGAALTDAGVGYTFVQEAYAGFVYADSTSGQRALAELGLTGIPIINVNNACATGTTALFLARRAITSGAVDCALAVGFEKMNRGSLGLSFPERTFPLQRIAEGMVARHGMTSTPFTAQLFAYAAKEYQNRYNTPTEALLEVAAKNHRHSVNNPLAQFQVEYTTDEIAGSALVADPLTKLQCSPTSDGAAAALVASERFVREHDLWDRAVEIAGQAMVSDRESSFDGSDIAAVGTHLTRVAATAAYEEAGLGPADAQVIELHDCFTINELLSYEALGLCPPGKAGALILDGATTYDGQWVVNPSGGLISKGHPVGATGVAQCVEINWQLRGLANKRQVNGAHVGIAHNAGLIGTAVVTVYRKASI